jgi:succinyl-CoA synthetase beta subunit
VIVNESVDINDEFYLAIVLDRTYNGPAFISSRKGGMDIEKVAEEDP